MFLCKDNHGNKLVPETYLPNTHFNELKALFLFDRELRFLFLKYLLILKIHSKQLFRMSFHRNIQKPTHIRKCTFIVSSFCKYTALFLKSVFIILKIFQSVIFFWIQLVLLKHHLQDLLLLNRIHHILILLIPFLHQTHTILLFFIHFH